MPKGEHLGDLEELVLLAVLRLGEDAYGGSVRRELKRRAGRSVSVSTVYVTLIRLEEKGLMASEVGDATTRRGGRPKRHFRLTPDGVDALRASEAARAGLREGLDVVLEELGGA